MRFLFRSFFCFDDNFNIFYLKIISSQIDANVQQTCAAAFRSTADKFKLYQADDKLLFRFLDSGLELLRAPG